MQKDELLVALLANGATVVRYLGTSKSRVCIALGRNRQARIPIDRILLSTGVLAATPKEAEEFGRKSKDLMNEINLKEIWEIVSPETSGLTIQDIARLVWPDGVSRTQLAALVIRLERDSDRFLRTGNRYVPRSPESVEGILFERRQEVERNKESKGLMKDLVLGNLPMPMTDYQKTLLRHLKGYAVHGDDYERASIARDLLKMVDSGSSDLVRRCFDLMVGARIFSKDEPLELHRARIRDEFHPDALKQAKDFGIEALLVKEPREDLTALKLFTIDDKETEDRDDAFSLEPVMSSPSESRGIFHLGIHITDVAALISPGSPLDREAALRMASLYLPDRKIPMLPPVWINGAGSLDPGERRTAISLIVKMNGSAEVLGCDIVRSLVMSKAALSYEDADYMIEHHTGRHFETLSNLGDIAMACRGRREKAGAINVDRPDMDIKLGPLREIDVAIRMRSSPARVLVAELMILANRLMAEFCQNNNLPAGYRRQPVPDQPDSRHVEDSGISSLLQYRMIGRLRPAQLSLTPGPHGGLGVASYIQTTSPLRRYPDLMMQRQIGHFLKLGMPYYSSEEIWSVMERAEVQLKQMNQVEESRKRYWFLRYLKENLLQGGESMSAVVLDSNARGGALLELTEFPFRFRAKIPSLYVAGNVIPMALHDVDLWRRETRFVYEPKSSLGDG